MEFNMVENILCRMIEYFENDTRRINHALKVYTLARNMGKLEKLGERDMVILETAAILHDIGIKESEKKYRSSAGHYQEKEGPPAAAGILKDFNLESSILSRICHLIGNHHSYGKIDGNDFQILIEADFIVNIFEDSMSRTQINSIKEKYFRTETGKKYVNSMYLQSCKRPGD